MQSNTNTPITHKTLAEITDLVELVSQNYAAKFNINRDENWFVLKLQEELGELIQSYLMKIGQARQKGQSQEDITASFQSELADVFCHVLLLAKHTNTDLEEKVEEKWLSRLEKAM
jgi:NTP pyrophosphatase (non-canonical NTP hydrolase)